MTRPRPRVALRSSPSCSLVNSGRGARPSAPASSAGGSCQQGCLAAGLLGRHLDREQLLCGGVRFSLWSWGSRTAACRSLARLRRSLIVVSWSMKKTMAAKELRLKMICEMAIVNDSGEEES